ncbi:hypothetical protein M433DRAFT_388281 [Acidomyces richmondensis BFW]|nr:MAG: hypothetical protein FE78DRAFT_525917 [Acidomyces sp. 'richmondensis']KYG42821.1 hypothetical protein M433DRAFT_388281 [Acidomyces richmondensis BFW]
MMTVHRIDPAPDPWGDMDEGGSPWDDVPSRSHSTHNLAQADSKAQDGDNAPSASTQASSSAVGIKPAPSKSRNPRRHGALAQSTTLETLDDDSMGPLGPLGMEPAVEPTPVAPALKEQHLTSRTKPPSRPGTAASSAPSDDGALNGSVRALNSPTASNRAGLPQQQQPPSVSVEQAAKPTFHITVGDPHTVGNAANSHTVYAVITHTTSKAYVQPNFTVQRRYRDFLWLYERLHDNNPGVVVPPPPEKQAVGRFDANFIESRRMALERMINKIAAHPILQHDGDLKTFLESEAFHVDIRHKERKDPLLGGGEGKGFMSSIGLGTGSSGGGKFVEHDDWFHDRRVYLDALENQLKALQKSTDAVVAQRKALAESCGDLSSSLRGLAGVELAPALSGPLDALADLQLRVQELYHRQAMQDLLTVGIVIDEYLRLIGSVKKAFEQRQKAFHAWHAAESRLQDIRKQQEKLLRAGRTQQDRIQQMQADVGDAERRVHASRLLFEDMGRLMRSELDRFEREKVEDFKSGVETFLESAIEAQKELIELWETYLYQLDADEDGPPMLPAGVRADPEPKPEAQLQRETGKAQLEREAAAERSSVGLMSGTTTMRDEDGQRESEEGTPGEVGRA